jgi:hypothetical protein
MPSNKKAVIKNGRIYYGEEAEIVLPNEMQARANREDMKVRHRKDMLQPNDLNYYRAYKDQAKNLPDDIRRLV